MKSVFSGSTHNLVFVSLALLATIFSSLASCIMLLLIRKLKNWNGHILLLTTMTIFQFIYDLSFFSGVVNLGNSSVSIISNTIQLFSGIGSSLTSNLVAFITFYVIFYKMSFDIFKYYYLMMVFVLLPSIIDSCLFLTSMSSSSMLYLSDIAVLEVYYYIKLISIALNFIFVGGSAIVIRRMRSGKLRQSDSEISINRLSMRLFYYPIVQTVSRLGCAWYEIKYKYNLHSTHGFDFNPRHTTNEQFVAQCLMALSTPISSVGYLIIFLIMQPRAYRIFCSMFTFDQDSMDSQNVVQPDETDRDDDTERYSMKSLISVSSESTNLRFSLMEAADFF
jgi:hypothetical protein